MVEEIDGEEITHETVLQAIDTMSDRVQSKVMNFAECQKITAGDPAEWSAKLYCEDVRLSLRNPGTEI